jgi:Predicted metallopeptidase (DUF2201).
MEERKTRLTKERRQNREKLAQEILKYSCDQLMAAMPFLNRAFYRMPFWADRKIKYCSTDGVKIYYNTEYILECFKQQPEKITRSLLHLILHCVFCHPFGYEEIEQEAWDLAADIAVENVILEMNKPGLQLSEDEAEKNYFYWLQNRAGYLTAEKLYYYLRKHPEEMAQISQETEKYRLDEHKYWLPQTDAMRESSGGDSYMHNIASPLGCGMADEGGTQEPDEPIEAFAGRTSEEWKNIREAAKMNLETFLKDQGSKAGSLLLNLEEMLREKEDFSEFLKKFAVTGEEIHLNDDEFDYIYYTYGLKLYENMPLIEPLEYRENFRIRDFVIAIDTSGSCQGELVKKFLDKTYAILTNEESFFSKVNIHIIQCDAQVQNDIKITSTEEFEHYMDHMTLAGFGGTDFRPVFAYVDKLVEQHEFQELRGLIYFTDGRGIFPEKMPAYRTAFVFAEEGFHVPEVPSWAIRMVVGEEDLE